MAKKRKHSLQVLPDKMVHIYLNFLPAKRLWSGWTGSKSRANDLRRIKNIGMSWNSIMGIYNPGESIALALLDFKPDEIYNLTAQSSPLPPFRDKLRRWWLQVLERCWFWRRASLVVLMPKFTRHQLPNFGETKSKSSKRKYCHHHQSYAAAKAAYWMASIAAGIKIIPVYQLWNFI